MVTVDIHLEEKESKIFERNPDQSEVSVKLCVIFENLRLKLYTAQPKTANPFSTSELHCHLRFKPHGGKVHLINNFLYPQNMMEIVYSCFAESEVFSKNVEFLSKLS